MKKKVDIEKIIDFIKTYPEIEGSNITVDYGVNDGENYNFTPSGKSMFDKERDVYRNGSVYLSYNCVLLITKPLLKGILGLENQIFIERLQDWVIEQNFNDGAIPVFGDRPNEEFLEANNASLLKIDNKAEMAVYSITFNVNYIREFRR